MAQLSLDDYFDPDEGRRRREEGMEKALHAERVRLWKIDASAWFDRQEVGFQFTADDLIAAIGVPDRGANKVNVVGAWFSAQAKTRRIFSTGQTHKSERAVRHIGKQGVWRKLK